MRENVHGGVMKDRESHIVVGGEQKRLGNRREKDGLWRGEGRSPWRGGGRMMVG